MVCLHLRFSGVVWAVWVGASWDGAPVLDYQWSPPCGRGARAAQHLPRSTTEGHRLQRDPVNGRQLTLNRWQLAVDEPFFWGGGGVRIALDGR